MARSFPTPKTKLPRLPRGAVKGNPLLKKEGGPEFVLVLVTVPDKKIARTLARLVLGKRLAACANLIPQIESHYWWRGKVEQGSEVLMVFKTTLAHLNQLEQLVISKHPYDTPEFLAVKIPFGNEKYLKWIEESVSPAGKAKG